MKQLAEYIFGKIQHCIDDGGSKQVIRIDGYEDIRLYHYIAKKLEIYCSGERKMIAKLSLAKYNQLQANAPYEASEMLSKGWIDQEDHMTSYRNIVPGAGECIVVLLMGTDMVADKGGLSDFFAIDPHTVDQWVKKKYSSLISSDLHAVFQDDRIDVICDRFFETLFTSVVQNLVHVSSIMDAWEEDGLTLQEVISDLHKRLPDWYIPMIVDGASSITPNMMMNEKRKLSTLQNACSFIRGKMFTKVTKATISNAQKKFDAYIADEKKYAVAFPDEQAIKSIEELRQCTMSFISGDRNALLVNKLLHTDFSILDDILHVKPPKKPKPEKAMKLTGDPLSVMLEALLDSFVNPPEPGDTVWFEQAKIRFTAVHLCDVPSSLDKSTERDELLMSTWSRIAMFAGGVVEFIAQEDWEMQDGTLLDIHCEPEGFLRLDRKLKWLEDGFISATTGKLHKIGFEVVLLADNEIVQEKAYSWQIDPAEGWYLAIDELLKMPEEQASYLPYACLKQINTAYTLKDEESFAYFMTHTGTDYNNCDILTMVNKALAGLSDEDRKEISLFYDLGERFEAFRNAVMTQGFYSVIGKQDASLIASYIALGDHIATSALYTNKLRCLVKFYVNAFVIGEDTSPITNDIYTGQFIVPPYHPATLEKLSDRMIFLRTGMRQWFNEHDNRSQSLHERLQKLSNLASVHNATDGFLRNGNTVFPCSQTFGFYTLYGRAKATSSFASAQDIRQKESVFDDDFNDSEMKNLSREAGVILRVLEQYMTTFPRSYANLSLAIVNPQNLQVIVSALYALVGRMKKTDQAAPFNLTLTIVSPDELLGARTYLAYWVNNMFTKDDGVDIKAYLKIYTDEQKIPYLVPENIDVTFFMDALGTDKNAGYNFKPSSRDQDDRMSECRFPMVFKPSVASAYASEHIIDITQPQFGAATAHTQVLHAYIDYCPNQQKYDLIQSAQIGSNRGWIISELQEHTVWLACIDSAMDKKTVRTLYAKNTGIIGFTTGEGSFGQWNMALTCRPNIAEDIIMRCKRRLRTLFPSWTDVQLDSAASFCLKKAGKLDGVSILRALNPADREINNYLAYLIADEVCGKTQQQLNVLIRLDSYRHWFQDVIGEEAKIPDFLLLSTDIYPNDHLKFTATVIECKIALQETMPIHLDKARKQVLQGIEVLSQHFDPKGSSIEHRYWMAQLYRAIVFLQTDMSFDEAAFTNLTAQLNAMLEGDYEITWHGRILGCEVDSNTHLEKDTVNYKDDGIELWKIGQLAMQNLLLQHDPADDIPFDAHVCLDVPDAVQEEENEEPEPDLVSLPTPIPVTSPQPIILKPEEKPTLVDKEHRLDPPPAIPSDKYTDDRTTDSVENVRVLIGKDKNENKVYWEYGHKGLANRHLLITGGSGQGKTYGIQTFLYELARQKISSVVFDYTDGFLPGKLEPPFAEELGNRVTQHIAIMNGIPINPFKRQTLTVAGMSKEEPSTLAAGRFAAIMKHVYSFGDQQYSALYSACRDGIDHYGNAMDFLRLRRLLEDSNTTYAKTVLSKMQQLFDLNLFDSANAFDWSAITEREGKVTIIQLTTLDREIQTIVTEMLMWDAWYSLVKSGHKDRPFVVVLDEAQNLSIADGSPAQKILQEGRKYGWSAWFATQFLKGALDSDEISRLQQAAEVLYFKPSNEETTWVAQQLGGNPVANAQWVEQIKQMQKGHCIVQGDRVRPNGTFGSYSPVMVKVSSFEDRR